MNQEVVFSKLKEIFFQVLHDIEVDLTESTTHDDVDDWDSITNIQLITEIEKKFQIRLSIREIESMKKMGDMRDVIVQKLN